MSSSFEAFILRYRLPFILALGISLTTLSYTLALGLRFDFDGNAMFGGNYFMLPLVALVTIRFGTYMYWDLNRGYWRYSSTRDLTSIIKAHAASAVLFGAALHFLRPPGYPRSVIIIELAVSILLFGGARFFVRLAAETLLAPKEMGSPVDPRDIIIIGAGDSGHVLVKHVLSHKRLSYRPVAVLDDSEHRIGMSIFGVQVLGPISKLNELLALHPHVSAVIVAIPSLSKSRFNQIEDVCRGYGVAVKKLQAFEDIACIDASVKQESLTIESVLEKSMKVEHETEIREALAGQIVLVTGAGGSIGAELCRQILPFKPKTLVLLDSCEFNLFQIERELRQSCGADSQIRAVICNITDKRRLHAVFAHEQPKFVYHAAAYKHVPLMEENAYEAFVNNVVGTRNLLDAAVQFSVARFVLISSDKAVAPSSIMGCSKLAAELLVEAYSAAQSSQASAHPLATAIVRFGNVINSTGSVIPIFKQQILSGGPITITHPKMERYFMSIREAVRLVLTAGTLGQRGEVFLLDMGKPMKIVDVAQKMMALYGRRDIEIVFTGVRPGEKLSEELLSPSELGSPTRFSKVFRVEKSSNSSFDVSHWVLELEERAGAMSNEELRDALMTLSRLSILARAERTASLLAAS